MRTEANKMEISQEKIVKIFESAAKSLFGFAFFNAFRCLNLIILCGPLRNFDKVQFLISNRNDHVLFFCYSVHSRKGVFITPDRLYLSPALRVKYKIQ